MSRRSSSKNSHPHTPRSSLPTYIALGIGFIASVGALAFTALGWSWPAIGCFTLASIAAVTALIRSVGDAELDFKPQQFSHAEVGDLAAIPAMQLSNHQVAQFVRAVAFPDQIISRVSERVRPATRALEFDVLYTLKVPHTTSPDPLYLPLIVERKGTLHDDLRIQFADGTDTPTVAYIDYVGLVRDCLRVLVAATKPAASSRYLKHTEPKLLLQIGSRTPKSTEDAKVAGEVIGELRTLVGNTPMGRLTVQFANNLIFQYAIVVQMPAVGEVAPAPATSTNAPTALTASTVWTTVRVCERKILPRSRARFRPTRPLPWMIEHVRRGFGIGPNRFDLSIERARFTSSYHLEFMGPAGTYLGRQQLDGYSPSTSSYVRLRPRLGQRYAHLYVRGHSDDLKDSVLKVSFFERPPGSIGATTLSAIAALALIMVGAELASQQGSSPSGDLVAVLLAFPGAVSAWVGLDRSTGPIGGTLSSRMSALVTLVLSLTATAAYLKTIHLPEVSDKMHLGPGHGVWAYLIALAALNAAWTTYAWVRRSLLYGHFLTRRPPTETES